MAAIETPDIVAAIDRATDRMVDLRDTLNRLDAALGDGDTGITVAKCAAGIKAYQESNSPGDDLGTYFIKMGGAVNRAASSSLGTLIATALMRAGKEVQGATSLDGPALARMLRAADVGVQERGKAKPGDKTIVDALHPAAEAFNAAIDGGDALSDAAVSMLHAARQGRDAVIASRSKIGRAAWVGERTENQPDPGTVLFVQVLEAVLQVEPSEPGSTSA
ncbi:MAG TPA: DAK2 domain-containing protein [Aggregatilinea sp.]|uniref:DAK2 domain-containing protein n=1 Tax=Aggregatilinea sp. TaxID=2806333 RepID=UPI002CA9551E|nr:DAK2 domain-containing protein [Aggregatilinea sp.]HML22001.1 DAK2 domain-containing protein [Aggregatilinea sp.]